MGIKQFAFSIIAGLFPLFSFSQNQVVKPAGMIIKFHEGISYPQQEEILSKFPELFLYPEEKNSLFPGVSYAEFIDKNLSEIQIQSLKSNLETADEVVFANILSVLPGGHFSAALGEFYVKLFSKNDFYLLESLAAETKTKILGEYKYMPLVYLLSADKHSKGNSKEIANYFSSKGFFNYASPNMMFSLEDCSPNDSLFPRQWSIENTASSLQFSGTPDADMDIDSAWIITEGDSSIKIAVLDSGVDTAHIDLAGNLLPGFDATGGNSGGYPSLNFPQDGHGTACAGIIASVANNLFGTAGIANKCKVIPVKVFYYISISGNVFPYSTSQWGLDAFNWAYQTAKADIMSNSWAIPDSLMAYLGIDTAISNNAINDAVSNGRNGKGIPMLFSAGNSPDTFVLWPARTPATIAVAATTMCDELKTLNDCSPENFWASNHGTGLDVSAPGVKIATTDVMGNKGFTSGNFNLAFNGTSAACPNSAGVMALILSANKNLTAIQAREILSASCEKVGGYDYNINGPFGAWSPELGYGRVNAFRALQLALGIEDFRNEEKLSFYLFKEGGRNYLSYTILYSAKVSIEIFDVLGRCILTKNAVTKNSGTHHESLDLSGSAGSINIIRVGVDGNFYSRLFVR